MAREDVLSIDILDKVLSDDEFVLACPYSTNSYDEILRGLVVGDCDIATDIEKLARIGITHILNTAEGTECNQIITGNSFYKGTGIQYFGIPGSDEETFDLSKYFSQGADFIREAIGTRDKPRKEGKILVHCMAGVSRSATIALVYMMRDHRMDLIDALRTARRKRYIYPNDGFLQLLIDYSNKLKQ